ncbi:hypothetical protein CHARACLAT_026054 [Characodon lateralis]|uniref:USP6 N-terminal-like protein n=1 Tax=Characodon lateralis TaxID=208331 RepID=A0ABU7DD37_9TELE|nr:hypothetical protein [Characodon lateralis]
MSYTILKLHKKHLMKLSMEELVEFLQVTLAKDFFFEDDFVIEQLQASMTELRRAKLELPAPGKEEEFPKKPLGQLPPEVAALVLNHVGNGQSHTAPAAPPRDSSPVPERQQDGRPPSRARRDSVERPLHPRRSNEILSEQQKQSSSNTPERRATPSSASTPTPQVTTVDSRSPQNHAITNHNSNAVSNSRQIIGPRWVKPSETKLEAAKAAAARATSPAPSSPNDGVYAQHRPRSTGFIPVSDRGSNASQYDNVPGLPEQDFEILELEKPPTRMRTPRNETPFNVPAAHQGSDILSVSTGPRMPKHHLPPQFPHDSPPEFPASYSGGRSWYNSPPQQDSPGRTTAEVPILHPGYSMSLDHRGEDKLYGVPRLSYREVAYATTQRQPTSLSPEKVLFNNLFATYRRPPPGSNRNLQSSRPPPEQSLQLESQSSSTPIYLQQLTSTTQIQTSLDYRLEGQQRGEANPHYLQGGRPQPIVDGVQWEPEDERPPLSPGGMHRSPSFQEAQMSPVHEFTFPANPDVLPHLRTQFQEQQQPVIRQQLPQLFGGPHYRHAQEAFALQESMLL